MAVMCLKWRLVLYPERYKLFDVQKVSWLVELNMYVQLEIISFTWNRNADQSAPIKVGTSRTLHPLIKFGTYTSKSLFKQYYILNVNFSLLP